ncbi:MAG TPA: DUF1573 domain-containing protein [Candidatus Paceibacterota bacterium]|nr:DUF1573 domain-containing protein [Candidatus Paceibacterota bacterium]
MNTKLKTTILVTLFTVAGIGLVLVAKPSPSGNSDFQASLESALAARELSYDFGRISMSRGEVNREFSFVNSGSKPLTVNRIYTSCMCTTATVIINGNEFGPFGMPGHGLSRPISAEIAPGEEGKLNVVFDPAAHGPAGVGPIERFVYIGTNDGATLRFRITALVTP